MKITRAVHPPARRRPGRAPVAVAVAAALAATALGTGAAQADVGPAGAAGGAGVSCPGLPRGLALIGNGPHNVLRVTRSRTIPVAGVRRGVITKAVRGRDGTIWVEARPGGRPNGEWRRIVRMVPDGGRRVSETGDVELSHVGTVGDRGRSTVATYIDRDRTPGVPSDDEFGGVYVEFSNGVRRSLGPAGAPESHSRNAAPAVRRVGARGFASVVAGSWFADLTEAFTFDRLHGGELRGMFDPTDDAPYNMPPLFSTPVLSPHGRTLSWTEGPDWSGEQNRVMGIWKLVIANSRTGDESLRVKVGRNGEELHHADFDGRYWVGTFSRKMLRDPRPSELRIRVVDTHAAAPRPIDAGCSIGFIGSIDRFVPAALHVRSA